MYLPASAGLAALDDLAQKGISRLWLNPGADDPAVVEKARRLGLQPIVACSILGVGESPGDF
jgi:hypothetical protein